MFDILKVHFFPALWLHIDIELLLGAHATMLVLVKLLSVNKSLSYV